MADLGGTTFQLEIVTPQRLIVSDEVAELIAPGAEGYFGVLPGHTPFMTTLDVGELIYRKGKDERHLAVTWGYVEVRGDRVIVLAETADTEVYQRLLGRSWMQRVIGSNAVSIPLDSVIFNAIAFAGVFAAPKLAAIVFGEIVVKTIVGGLTALWRSSAVRGRARAAPSPPI